MGTISSMRKPDTRVHKIQFHLYNMNLYYGDRKQISGARG